MTTQPEMSASLRDIFEIGSAIEGLAEILQELDISREVVDDLPDWYKPRHTAALIAAIKNLAGESIDQIERVQERMAGDGS